MTDPERVIVQHMIGAVNFPDVAAPGLRELIITVRTLLAQYLREPARPRAEIRRRVVEMLPQALRRSREARLSFGVERGGFHVYAVPVLDSVDEMLVYGLALLLDTRRGYARGLQQCTAPERERADSEEWADVPHCGRFFWRRSRREVYCSARCKRLGTRKQNTLRMRRWRPARR